MKKIALLCMVACALSLQSFAQNYVNVAGNDNYLNGQKFAGTFMLTNGDTIVKPVVAGGMTYKTSDHTFYGWNGTKWIALLYATGVTASNGLTKVGSDIQLGGRFTKNDTLDLPANDTLKFITSGFGTEVNLSSVPRLNIHSETSDINLHASNGNAEVGIYAQTLSKYNAPNGSLLGSNVIVNPDADDVYYDTLQPKSGIVALKSDIQSLQQVTGKDSVTTHNITAAGLSIPFTNGMNFNIGNSNADFGIIDYIANMGMNVRAGNIENPIYPQNSFQFEMNYLNGSDTFAEVHHTYARKGNRYGKRDWMSNYDLTTGKVTTQFYADQFIIGGDGDSTQSTGGSKPFLSIIPQTGEIKFTPIRNGLNSVYLTGSSALFDSVNVQIRNTKASDYAQLVLTNDVASWSIQHRGSTSGNGGVLDFLSASNKNVIFDVSGFIGSNVKPDYPFHAYTNGSNATLKLEAAGANNANILLNTNGSFRYDLGSDASGNFYIYQNATGSNLIQAGPTFTNIYAGGQDLIIADVSANTVHYSAINGDDLLISTGTATSLQTKGNDDQQLNMNQSTNISYLQASGSDNMVQLGNGYAFLRATGNDNKINIDGPTSTITMNVAGSEKVFVLKDDGGNGIAYFDNTSTHLFKVGINKSSPDVTLDVLGHAKIQGITGDDILQLTAVDGSTDILEVGEYGDLSFRGTHDGVGSFNTLELSQYGDFDLHGYIAGISTFESFLVTSVGAVTFNSLNSADNAALTRLSITSDADIATISIQNSILQYIDGNQDVGKILASDGSGNASWQPEGTVPHTIFTPTTGSSITMVNNNYNIVNPAGALLALTVTLPASPANNDVVRIKFTKAVTTVTYSGGTVSDGIVSPTAGGYVILTYDSGTTTWY